jgi:hypothetical protein
MYVPIPELLAVNPVIQKGSDVEIPVVTENSLAALPDPDAVSVVDVTFPSANVLAT